MSENKEMCIGWDDAIESDGNGFSIIEEGDYNFTVDNFERGRFPGSKKIDPCNKAIITVKAHTDDGDVTVKFDLILHRSLEWKLSSFFRSIGQKKHGERLVPNWNTVTGSYGRAHFKPRTYTGSDGSEKKANDVAYFIDYDPEFFGGDSAFIPINADEEIPFGK